MHCFHAARFDIFLLQLQFPTLGFIVERYWEIQAHEPEEFWTINCSHESEEGLATFNWMYFYQLSFVSLFPGLLSLNVALI